ncbi:hypothetical protein D3C72_1559200 [compost metagenome]
MDQRDDRAHGELPLEAECQVDKDAAQCQEHAHATLVAQLLTHLRAYELDTLDLGRVVAAGLLQGFSNLVAQLRVIARHAHQQVGGGAEALHHRLVEAGIDQLGTHRLEVGRALVGQLDQRTAGEVQAEVQALLPPAEQRQHGEEHGNGERDIAHAHEVDGFHRSSLKPTAS